jgi:hypothetical protein
VRLSLPLSICLLALLAAPARAEVSSLTDATPLIGFGAGSFDSFDNVEQDKSTDLRLEYRFGTPFWHVIKPQIGFEATTDGSAAFFGGIVADYVLWDHVVIAPSFSVGAYASGAGKEMGSIIQFRSQIEAGYRFDSGWRVAGALSHISNAELGDKNHGSEILTLYVQLPADILLPR